MENRYVKVLLGNISQAGGKKFKYKIDKINIAKHFDLHDQDPKTAGGFNFSTEDNIIRWLVRGDTMYDVILPDDAIMVKVESPATPDGVFRTDKIILTNPRPVTDEMAMHYYLISNLPERTYFKTIAGCVIRGYLNTAKKIVDDKITKENLELAIKDYLEMFWHKRQFKDRDIILEYMKNSVNNK